MTTVGISVGDRINSFAGTTIEILIFVGISFSFLGNGCALLMFHLSYYSIAHHIRLLRVKMMNNCKTDPWKDSKKILTHLYEASSSLGTAFSVAVLYTITTRLVVISFNTFVIIYGLVKKDIVFPISFIINISVEVVSSLIQLLIILYSADMPVYQV